MSDVATDDPANHPKMIRARAMLPGWFTERMMTDTWEFGLLLVTGQVIAISSILEVHESRQGSVWIDVNMLEESAFPDRSCAKLLLAPTSRTQATINAACLSA